jgi:hypothetical protein
VGACKIAFTETNDSKQQTFTETNDSKQQTDNTFIHVM